MSIPLIEMRGIRFSYGDTAVLHDVDFRLQADERVGIMGPVGCGKTTFLHLMVGLLKPTAGQLFAFGDECTKERQFRSIRRRAGLVFQDPDDQLFCPTVIEDVSFGPLNLGKSIEDAKRMSRDALSHVGLEGFEERITYKLSGGEKRLIALATVLAMEPEVLLLDEPTSWLDKTSVDRVAAVLNGLPQSMVVVSHEPEFLDRVASRRATLCDGRLARTFHLTN